ncbi:hypothetical protein [Paenibacillus protaetiae]|uniref:Uncharacterized protein n=1 Tax=Paenibacillus protaetiae TaxID=2509456 RepID=A0A4V0YFI4_9BACL|nr:hypothetical protein [Paenibacillus protaetiae]QAY67821.1 hypothetical protein ET464_16910 [Paenibacillus protaetiae]
MMSKVQAVIKMHFKDRWSWFMVPAIVLFSSFLVNLFISFLVRDEQGIQSGGVSSIYIYTLVLGILVPAQTFSFSIGLSVRRKDYFWGVVTAMAIFTVVIALLLSLLSIIEGDWTGGWGVKLSYFHLPYLNDGNIAVQFGVSLCLLLFMSFMGLFIASIVRRYGRKGMYAFTLVMMAALTVTSYLLTYYKTWGPVFEWLGDHSAWLNAVMLLPLAALFGLCSFLMLRKAS